MSTAEISNLDIASMEGEEVILIQAINSIQTIIKLNPSSHEKVLYCEIDVSAHYGFHIHYGL